MDYKYKYEKYKQKYKQITNNTKEMNMDIKFKEILDFLNNSDKNTIFKNLYSLIYDYKFCPVLLGEGHFGKVYTEVNNTFPYKINNKMINLPIVIKESRMNPDIKIGMDIINNILYISGYDNITLEMLILIFLRNLYNKTVHLPLIMAYGNCLYNEFVTRIITRKYGLKKQIEINLDNKIFNDEPLWIKPRNEKKTTFISSINTVKELFAYIHYTRKGEKCILPNNIECNVIELYDYLCISYLITHYLLTQNNIYPSDMSSNNIFIHWLNDDSYYDNVNIKNIEEIVYNINNKFYKIKTFGFVIIFGDTGNFKIKIKKDIILIGQIYNIVENYKLLDRVLKEEYTNTDFLLWNFDFLPFNIFKNTIAYNILNSEPYNDYPLKDYYLLGKDIKYLDSLKSTLELLNYYDKYCVSKYIKNQNNILIKN